MNAFGWVAAGVVVLLAAVALIAGLGFGSVSTRVESEEGHVIQLPDRPEDGAVVINSFQKVGGFSLLGIDITKSKWAAQVMFIPPEGCTLPADGKLVATGACASVPIEGDVNESGVTEEQLRLWTVEIEIPKACHEALTPGDSWPSAHEACAATD